MSDNEWRFVECPPCEDCTQNECFGQAPNPLAIQPAPAVTVPEKQSRAIRRHHVARLKRSRRHYWGNLIAKVGAEHGPEWVAKRLGQLASTPHACSCDMGCGNRRKHEGPTIQERRTALAPRSREGHE